MTFRSALRLRPGAAALLGSLLAAAAAPGSAFAQAQATVKPDGQVRYAFVAGTSFASGNTSSSNVDLSGAAVRATADSHFDLDLHAVRTRGNGATTAENLTGWSQYNQDLTPDWFGFGRFDGLRDKFANLDLRASLYGGAGRHVLRTDTLRFDLSAGLGYTEDRYVSAADVNGQLRTSYGRAEALLAEESNHKLTPTTTLRQKLSIFPALRSGGDYRAVFDAGLAVAIDSTFSLNVGYNYRYNNDPGVGLKKYDALLTTGLQIKID